MQHPGQDALVLQMGRLQVGADAGASWEWQDDRSRWRTYDKASATKLERGYQAAVQNVELGGRHGWHVNLASMQQTNTAATGTTRAVRRRGPTSKALPYPVRRDLLICDVVCASEHFAPAFDRFYVTPDHPRANQDSWLTSWRGRLAGRPGSRSYFCPSGWRRFSLNTDIDTEFFKDSSIMYHGTAGKNVEPIVRGGFKPRLCQHGAKAVYLTPSIRYAAHPRYAHVYKAADGRYFQIVLEVRVVNKYLTSFKGETMQVYDKFQIDPNFAGNDGMEFLFKSNAVVEADDGIAVTGIMMRVCPNDPLQISESAWWTCWRTKEFLHEHYYTGLRDQPGDRRKM